MAKLARRAALCYNGGRNIVVSKDAMNTLRRVTSTLLRRLATMDTLPPHADNGNIPAAPGIYKIICIPTKKIYIGSAVNLQHRRLQHFSELRQNKHYNPHLQRAWNKYGPDAFLFEVLEYVLPISLIAREQYWFKTLKPFGKRGFNIAREAGSPLGVKHSPETIEKFKSRPQSQKGRKHTPEHVEKIRQSQIGKIISAEHKQALREFHTGRGQSEASKQKIREARAKQIITEEHRRNIGTGVIASEAYQQSRLTRGEKVKASPSYQASREKLRGQKLSEEHRRKMSESHQHRLALQREQKMMEGTP